MKPPVPTTTIPSAPQTLRPEFVRMPRPGSVCQHCGLSRAHLYALSNEGKIKTVSIRKRGAARGVRLIVLDSVLEYLRAHIDTGQATGIAAN